MLRVVIDAMDIQPCNAGFESARDALLAAEIAESGGAHPCIIWSAFARRGLGASADQSSSSGNADNVAAFDLPVTCDALFADGFE